MFSDDQEPKQNSFVDRPWTQDEISMLHDMVRDYDRARWFRRQLKWWAIWVLGVPAAIVMFIEPIDRLIKLFKGWIK